MIFRVLLCIILFFCSLLNFSIVAAAPLQFTGGETGTMLDEMASSTGTASLQSTTVKTGVYAYRANPAGGSAGYQALNCIDVNGLLAGCGSSDVWLGFHFRVDTRPNGTQVNSGILTGIDITGAATKFELLTNNTGNLLLRDSVGSTLSTGSTVLATTQWYFLELKIISGASGAYELKIDGASEFTGTGNFTVVSFGEFRFGVSSVQTSGTVNFFYDNMVMEDAAFPGELFIKALFPDADGSTAQWTFGTGASDWTQIDEQPFDLADYEMSTTSVNQVALAALQSPSPLGIVGTIPSTKVIVSRRENTSVTSSDKIRTREGATNIDSTAIDLTTTAAIHVKRFNTKPSGGAWTVAALDGTEIGAIEANAVSVRLNAAVMMVLYDAVQSGRLLPLTGVGK